MNVNRPSEDLKNTFLSNTNNAQSWSLDLSSVNTSTFDLSVKNPNVLEAVAHRSPKDIMHEIVALDVQAAGVLERIRELL